MDKLDFLVELLEKLQSLPEEDRQRTADYYAEMIDERMEDGMDEEEAVAAIGDLDEIVKQILAETPAAPAAEEPPKTNRKFRVWEIILLILGSPVWLSLLIAAAAVVFSVWISLWAVVISLYAAAVSLGAAALGCILGSFFMIGGAGGVMVACGAALVCAGLAIPVFMLSNLAARGMIALTKHTWKGTVRMFGGKERTV